MRLLLDRNLCSLRFISMHHYLINIINMHANLKIQKPFIFRFSFYFSMESRRPHFIILLINLYSSVEIYPLMLFHIFCSAVNLFLGTRKSSSSEYLVKSGEHEWKSRFDSNSSQRNDKKKKNNSREMILYKQWINGIIAFIQWTHLEAKNITKKRLFINKFSDIDKFEWKWILADRGQIYKLLLHWFRTAKMFNESVFNRFSLNERVQWIKQTDLVRLIFY